MREHRGPSGFGRDNSRRALVLDGIAEEAFRAWQHSSLTQEGIELATPFIHRSAKIHPIMKVAPEPFTGSIDRFS